MTQPKLDLGKAILADLDALKYEDKDVLLTDDGGYDITVGDLRCLITRKLELAETIEKVRDYIGCGIHDGDGNLKSECTISITELDNCFEWLDEALATRKGGPNE